MSPSSPAECLEIVRRFRPRDAVSDRQQLDAVLDALLLAVPPSRRHLEVLEAMRSVLEGSLSVLTARYASQPPAPDDPENETLQAVTTTWRKMGEIYALIAQDSTLGHTAETHALLAQRRIDCAGRVLLEHMRAHRAVPPGTWAALHACFADAEARGFAYVRAPDVLNLSWQAQSPAEAHMAFLLMDLAGPFSCSAEEFEHVWRCARHFAAFCRLLPVGSDDEDGRRNACGIDVARDHGLLAVSAFGAVSGLRRFDSSPLREEFRQVGTRVRKAQSAAELGLEGIEAEQVVELLLKLYRPWARGSVSRRYARHKGSGHAELTGDWRAIGFYLSGKVFSQPSMNAPSGSMKHDMLLLTLGDQVSRAPRDERAEIRRAAEHRGYFCTRWDVLDHSLGGFRLCRLGSADRLDHRSLVAIRPSEGRHFMLGMVSWMMFREDGALEAGIKLLDGVPKMVAVRSVGVGRNRYDVSFQQAFRLAATPALQVPATIVLPAGYFQPFRVIEVFDEKLTGIRLIELVHRGANFDHATFEAVSVVA